MKKIIIGSDHAGFAIKEVLKPFLESLGYEVKDCGPAKYDPDDDYPDFARAVAEAMGKNPADGAGGDFGILICGSGFGMDIAANKNEDPIKVEVPPSGPDGVEANIECLTRGEIFKNKGGGKKDAPDVPK